MRELNLRILETQTNEKKFALNKPESSKNDFEQLLVEAVDEGLSSLGGSCKEAIYFYLRNTFEIEKQEIPYKIEEFANALEKVFGAGAKLIEIKIMKALYQRVNQFKYFPKQGDLIFTEYIAALRHLL